MPKEVEQSVFTDYIIVNPEEINPQERVTVYHVLNELGIEFIELDSSTQEARESAAKKYSTAINNIAEVVPGPRPKHTKKPIVGRPTPDAKEEVVKATITAEYYGAKKAMSTGAKIIEIHTGNVEYASNDFKKLHEAIRAAKFALRNPYAEDKSGVRSKIAEDDPDAEPIELGEI